MCRLFQLGVYQETTLHFGTTPNSYLGWMHMWPESVKAASWVISYSGAGLADFVDLTDMREHFGTSTTTNRPEQQAFKELFLSRGCFRVRSTYPIPYRCFTSIDNMFMAGRNISVTSPRHDPRHAHHGDDGRGRQTGRLYLPKEGNICRAASTKKP